MDWRFSIWIDGELLTREAIQGKTITRSANLPGVGPVTLRITVMDSPKGAKQAGIVTRVGTKIVGKPSLLGADDDEVIPRKLFKRVVGEIEADGLEGDVTSDSGALFEDSKFCRDVQTWAQEQVGQVVREEFARQINLAKARQQKKINEGLAKLPEFRRPFAEKAIEKAMGRFYPDSGEKFELLTFIVLEAFEKTEYWTVCQKIEEAHHTGVIALADALQEFGLADLAYMGEQARRRIQFLDEVDGLARDESTVELTMHRSLETNLWVLGPEYTLMASNKTLATTIKEYVGEEFAGPRAGKRPDLLLAQSVSNRYLLIEFKRPSHTIVRDDENQAEKYRDDLTPRFGTIDILVIGGKRSPSIQAQYDRADIKLMTYGAIFSTARTQLDWLLRQLAVPT